MKNWLPRFSIFGAYLCNGPREYEGWSLSIEWRRWCIEVNFASLDRDKHP